MFVRLFILLSFSVLVLSSAATADARGYTETRYPIVLAHGASGFDQLFGVLDYWYGIPSSLAEGGAEVFVTEVSSFHQTEVRGEQLLAQIAEIVAVTGSPRVNLIGHSHGGLDARYVAAVRPDLIASVTTVGSPHKGADLADFLRANLSDGSFGEGVLALFGDSLGKILALLSGHSQPQDAVAALESLTREGTALFNAIYPQAVPATECGEGESVVDGVRYFSWSGTRQSTNVLDLSDPLLVLAGLVYDRENDGLVDRCSAHLGEVIRDDYRQNHADEINQILGVVHLLSSNPKSIFRAHANRLRNLGL